jgi:hypothetical protein
VREQFLAGNVGSLIIPVRETSDFEHYELKKADRSNNRSSFNLPVDEKRLGAPIERLSTLSHAPRFSDYRSHHAERNAKPCHGLLEYTNETPDM